MQLPSLFDAPGRRCNKWRRLWSNPLEVYVNFVPVTTAKAGFTGLLVFQTGVQDKVSGDLVGGSDLELFAE